jgi:hypothetical protein
MQPRVVVVEDELLAWQLVEPGPDALQPERRLMAAVLGVALADYQTYATETDVWGKRRFATIEAWFASDDTYWPFSFVAICETLGLDGPAIRVGIRGCRGRPPIASAGPAFFGRG